MDDTPDTNDPPARARPASAPERDVIRSGLGLTGRTGGDVIRRNRRRKRQEPTGAVREQPAANATVEVAVPTRKKQVPARPAPKQPPPPAPDLLDDLGDLDDLVIAPPTGLPEAKAKAKPSPAPAAPPRETIAERPAKTAPAPRPAPEPAPEPAPPAEQVPPKIEVKERAPRKLSGAKLLQTRGLVKVYDGRAVVDGVDINVREQEIVGLLGPNGAGKTTSFYMIVGLVQPNGGHVEFNGADATTQPMYKRARLGMGYLPQEESIFRKLSVKDNIMAVLETQNYSRKERRERCYDLMQRFGIEKLANNIAITLSGGEKRRLTIARSLVTNPKLLMLDEPFSGVDPIAVGEIQDIICDLREQGLAILITDHNVRETLGIVDRAYLIYEGEVLMEGSRDDLVNDPEARKLYLGQSFSM